MTLKVNLCNGEVDIWDKYVHSNPNSTNYHQIGWRDVIERSFSHKTYYFMAVNSEGLIKGVLPMAYIKSAMFGKFMVSIPFFNYGGLLCDDDEAEVILLKEAQKTLNELGAAHLELRHFKNYDLGLSTQQHKVTMIIDLKDDVDSQWKAFNAKLRNQIRKAVKSRLKIKIGHLELFEDFYSVFSRNMRDLGTPVYSKEFFKNILNNFTNTTKVFSVTFQNKVIASGIATWYRDVFEVPWASSIRDYNSLCPNNLLYWEAIKFAIVNGFKKFDFGRCTPGESTYRFKKQWGSKPVQLYWQYSMKNGSPLPRINTENPKYQLAIRLWKKFPVSFTQIVGPRIVKNIP